MNLADFHFIRPWWLLALPAAVALLVMLYKNRYGRGDWTTVCDAELLPYILQETPAAKNRHGFLGGTLAALLTILALAGPTWERLPSPAFRNDSALVIALDLSKSMDATDVKPSRIVRARYKIADILKSRKDGQTALLVYSGDTFTVTPLTTDTATINSQLEALTTDIMPSPGSNTAVALQRAVDLLHQAGLAQGHILLVTDGADADSARRAGDILGDYRLSVLALGSEEGAPIPSNGGGFLKDDGGNIVVAKLDAATLSALAQRGHGLFQTVTANDDDIERLAGLFNQPLQNADGEQSDLLLQQWDEKGPWLLVLVLPWAAMRFRKGLLTLAILALLPLPRNAQALDWQSLWQTSDQRGQEAFRQQQFEQAAERFDNPDWRAAAQYKAGQYQQAAETLKDSQTADGHYNRGNALAKAGQLREALQAYQQALQLDPNHADAKHNQEVVEKQLQDQQKQQGEDKPSSEQSSKDQQQQKQEQDKSSDSRRQNQQQGDEPQQSDAAKQDQQKPEQPPKDADQQPQNQNQDQARDGEQDQPEQQEPQPQNQEHPATAKPEKPRSETDRANEQLLKRIPDEPTGLLKRKFRYQYGQRRQSAPSGPDW